MLLLGQALSRSNFVSLSDTYLINLQSIFNFEFTYLFDVGYGTNFFSKPHPADPDLYFASYDFNTEGTLDLSIRFEVLKAYFVKTTFHLTLWDVTPYRQFITWVRPESLAVGSKTEFDVQLHGTYKIALFEWQQRTEHNAKTIDVSFVEWVRGFFDGIGTFPGDLSQILPFPQNFGYVKPPVPYLAKELHWDPKIYFDGNDQWYGERTLWAYQVGTVIPPPL